MTASTTTVPSSTSVYTTPAFWERLWRTSGLQFVVLFILASLIYGSQPQIGASADALAAWLRGFWAPDGAYSRFVSPLILLLWVLVVSRVLLARGPSARGAW